MIEKRKREELYDKFRQGAVPSGADFADFIRSQLNLLDDGIDISENPDDPICFRAHGEKENFLDFSDPDNRRRWRISGRCEDESKEGLSIKADENSKLYIERESGNVGLSTDQPTAKLHVIQNSAADALRIDDERQDQTPLIVTSDGQVGIGLENPGAKLHISYDKVGDILRVDDTKEDTTPFIINEAGNVGIGYSDPQAKLMINGAVSIGEKPESDKDEESKLGGKDLYVEGSLEVAGSVVFSGESDIGGIEINAPLTSKKEEVIIKDNLRVIPDPGDPDNPDDPKPPSDGNLSVAGDTTLGTFNKVPELQNVVTVNGRIKSGNNPQSGEEQYELVVNDILTINRDTNSPQAKVQGNLDVAGDTILGNSKMDQIFLNGTVSSNEDVIIDDDLRVSGSTTLGNSQSDNIYLNGTIVASTGMVNISDSMTISNDLNVNGSLMFDNSGTSVDGIVTKVNNNDDSVITTEGAVKNYVDNQVTNLNNKINIVDGKIPDFYRDCRYQVVPGPTGSGSWGSGHTSFYDFHPPSGFNMSQLIYFSVSPARIPFAGGVDGNDTMACYAEAYSSYIRCYCGNSEQRANSTVAFYALWRR